MPQTSPFIAKSLESPKGRSWRQGLGVWLFCAALAALFLLPQALTQSVIMDEFYSRRAFTLPVASFIAKFHQYMRDAWDHPPLFFILQRGVYLLFGDDPLPMRSIALISLTASMAIWGLGMGRRGLDWAGVLILCLLLVLHPELRYQGAFCRMYPLLLIWTSLIMLFIWTLPELVGGKLWRRAAEIGILLALSLYTSYFTLLLGGGIAFMAACWFLWPGLARQTEVIGSGAGLFFKRRQPALALILAGFIGGALCLPWLHPILELTRMQDRISPLGINPRSGQYRDMLNALAGTKWGLAFLVPGWIALLALRREMRARWSLALISYAIIPFALLIYGSPPNRTITLRYLVFAISIVLTGALLGWWSLADRIALKPAARLVMRLVFGLSIVPFYLLCSKATYLDGNPEWWGAAKSLIEASQPGERVLTGGLLSDDSIKYHVKKLSERAYGKPLPVEYLTGRMNMNLFFDACKDPSVVWYVNNVQLPPEYALVERRFFPWRIVLPCARLPYPITISAKKPFLKWDGTPATQYPVEKLPGEK